MKLFKRQDVPYGNIEKVLGKKETIKIIKRHLKGIEKAVEKLEKE